MIIKCPECGREISDKAASCPHCGCPKSAWMDKPSPLPEVTAESVKDPSVEDLDAGPSWDLANRNIHFYLKKPGVEGSLRYLVCEGCGRETGVLLKDFEKRDNLFMAKFDGNCPGCGRRWEEGDIFQEKLSPTSQPARSASYSSQGIGRSYTAPDPEYEKKKGGWVAKALIVLLAAVLIFGFFNSRSSTKSTGSRSSSSYSSSGSARASAVPVITPKPTEKDASTIQFEDDAEELMKMAKSAFGEEAAVSWMVNGKKATLTIRVRDVSSDDLADWFSADPAAAQDIIDTLSDSMTEANKSIYDKLKEKGHSGFKVFFEMQTSDSFTIAKAENGVAFYKMTKDDFRFG